MGNALHLDKDWEMVAKSQMNHGTKPPSTSPSKYVLSFPLSYVVDKCYKYSPLVTLGKAFAEKSIHKEKYLLPFQVLCFPYGYDHSILNKYLQSKFFPQYKIIIRGDGQERFLPAQTFREAAVSFLSEPFALDEDIAKLGFDEFPEDTTVCSSVVSNSSIWVIGPCICMSQNKANTLEERCYYRIAAAVTYCATPSGMYIMYIRSYTGDECFSQLPWDISLLKFPNDDDKPTTRTSIDSQRLGVLLLCAIQSLSDSQKSLIDLYLQTDFHNQSFMWFITFGFCYSLNHFGPVLDDIATTQEEFPLCSNASNELPEELGRSAHFGDISYITAADDGRTSIRLLTLKNIYQHYYLQCPKSQNIHN